MSQVRGPDRDSRGCSSFHEQHDIDAHAGSIPTTIVSWDLSLDELRGSCGYKITKRIEVARGGADVFRAEIVYMSVIQRHSLNKDSEEQQKAGN
jgi:hypothetical protein